MSDPLISLENVSKIYQEKRLIGTAPKTVALDDVSLDIYAGESVAIVGESGSGKTTLLRLMLGLTSPNSGRITFDGRAVKSDDRMLWLRSRTGLVFQDPYSTLNPRRTVGKSVIEPLEAIGAPGDHREVAEAIMSRMELPDDTFDRYPREFSGGQRQRVALARALVHRPDVLVGDEPVSALDVLVRGRLLDLLRDLRQEMGLTLITVTHDLAVVPKLAERIAVMQAGKIVETGSVDQIFNAPRHEYTRGLISALPRLNLSD
ncbi:MAG: ABC transporter ATP-binding protein [Canibacter sp.]